MQTRPAETTESHNQEQKALMLQDLIRLPGVIQSVTQGIPLEAILGVSRNHVLVDSYNSIQDAILCNIWDQTKVPITFKEFTENMTPASKERVVVILGLYVKDFVFFANGKRITKPMKQAIVWIDSMIQGIDLRTKETCEELGIPAVSTIVIPQQTVDVGQIIMAIVEKVTGKV